MHDRYGHIVALSAKFLCLKMEFHKKVAFVHVCCIVVMFGAKAERPPPQHKVIPGNLEASDETLEREAGSDTTKVYVPHTLPTHVAVEL